MSVIIRLQNLPWSANAMDIRQFFRGLSIPEGGVHIVGGEMGDAFIAFSTDEDARQAMMHDRETIKEVQVRLLLSSRAEMQKVIEKARLNSLSVFQQLAAAAAVPARSTPMPAGFPLANKSPAVLAPTGPTPSFLAYQQQAGITLTGSPISASDFDANNKNSTNKKEDPRGDSFKRSERSHERERERRRSTSRERRDKRRRHEESRSRSRERERERGRNRDRERDSGSSRRYDRSRRSSSRGSRERDREHSHGRSHNRSSRRSESRERDPRLRRDAAKSAATAASLSWEHGVSNAESAEKLKPNAWSTQATNSYQTNSYQAAPSNAYSTATTANKEHTDATIGAAIAAPTANSPEIVIPAFQNYTTSTTTTTVSNNYSINLYGAVGGGNSNSNSNSSDVTALKNFVLQNPYTTAQQQQPPISPVHTVESKSLIVPKATDTTTAFNSFAAVDQEPIAFAKTNPYEQMYPNLFAQAAAQQMPRSNASAAQRMSSPSRRGTKSNDTNAYPESSSIKVSDMCTNTNYSDLRKFFAGLFIPHNGIKMVNDKHGMRTGVAYIQFSRSNSVPKALQRNRSMLKSNIIQIEAIPDEEFNEAEDGCRSHGGRFNNDGDKERNRSDGGNNMAGNDQQRGHSRKANDEPFSVLYLEELPPLTTEQDLMKMFSSYSLYDILLLPSAENRREYVAHVKFSLPDDARAALEDKSKHMIGYRKVRVYAGKDEDMEKAKEKLRLANEQLLKEEQEEAMRAAEAEAAELERRSKETSEIDDDLLADMKMEDMSMSPPLSSSSSQMRDPRGNRDPRLIPSLLEMPPSKPPPNYDETKNNSARNMAPADPRLRSRTRPSRFDKNDANEGNASTLSNEALINNNTANNGLEQLTRNPSNPFLGMPNGNGGSGGGNMNNNNFSHEMQQQHMQQQQQMPFQRNMMLENNFVYIFNCSYNTCQMDIADLFRSANMLVKHVELLNNDRGMPSGEFIVEVFNERDADTALNEFNNIQFRGRSLRIRPITPQGIADRLKKPFMNYMPGGGGLGGPGPANYNHNSNNNNIGGGGMMMMMNAGGMRGSGGINYSGDMIGSGSNSTLNDIPNRHGRHGGGVGNMQRAAASGRRNRNNNYKNDNDDKSEDSGDYNNEDYISNDAINNKNNLDNERFSNTNGGNSGGGGIPEKFTRSNCVLAMGNVPYKADVKDILRFFSGFNLRPDDIVRRYNDDGSATSDARVVFASPADAQAAYAKCNRKQIFNRTIYLNIV